VDRPRITYALQVFRPAREPLGENQVIDGRNGHLDAGTHGEQASASPQIVERYLHPVRGGSRPRHEHVDALIVLEDITAPAPGFLGRPRRQEIHRLDGLVEARDVLRVDPEVVAGGEHGDPERHESPSSDQERPRSAALDCPKGLGLVELRSPHLTGVIVACARGGAAGVPVVVIPRCPEGPVTPLNGFVGGGRHLLELGVLLGGDLGGPKARIRLMVCLGVTSESEELRRPFESGLR
jgi:hypothetical protein